MRSRKRRLILPIANAITHLAPWTGAFRVRNAAYRAAGVEIGPRARINGYTNLGGTSIHIGNSWIGAGTWIVGSTESEVRIGDNCDLGPGVLIVTGTHHIAGPTRRAGPGRSAPVIVEDGCWIGARAVLMPGTTVGRGSIVAAGAVVTKNVLPNTLVAGVPARMIRQLS